MYVPSPAQVEGVSVRALSDTAVEVSWTSVALPLEELTGYKVYYRETVQAKCMCEEFEMFPRDVSSGVIGGLATGVSYQFQVTALARTVDGTEVEGEASHVNDGTITTPEEQGRLEHSAVRYQLGTTMSACTCTEGVASTQVIYMCLMAAHTPMHYILLITDGSEDNNFTGDYSTGELTGAIVVTFFITILVYTVMQVSVVVFVRKLKRRRYFKRLHARYCIHPSTHAISLCRGHAVRARNPQSP